MDNGAGGDQPPKIKRAVTASKLENPLLRGLQFYISCSRTFVINFFKDIFRLFFSNPSKAALGGNSTGAGNSRLESRADRRGLKRTVALSGGLGCLGLLSSMTLSCIGRRKALFLVEVFPELRRTSYDRPVGLMPVIRPLVSQDLV